MMCAGPKRGLLIVACIGLIAILAGCDDLQTVSEETEDATSYRPLRAEDLPAIDRDDDPSPTTPATATEEPKPDYAAIAKEFLPAPVAGMPAPVARDEIVVSLLDCHRTAAGITSTTAVVNVGDEVIETVINTGGMIEKPQHRHESVIVVQRDQRIVGQETAVTLAPRVPVTIVTLWLHQPNRSLGDVASLQVGIADVEKPVLFNEPRVDAPRTDEMTPEEIETAVSLLQHFCFGEEGGMAYWQFGQTLGRVAVRLTEFAPDAGSLAGEFFIPGEPTAVKKFTGTINADGTEGRLRTTKRSGPRGQPTREPSTINLLLNGTEAEYSLRLSNHELYGEAANGSNFRLCITTVPVGAGQ